MMKEFKKFKVILIGIYRKKNDEKTFLGDFEIDL